MKSGLKIYQKEIFNDDLKIEKEKATDCSLKLFITNLYSVIKFLN